jgi:hypothetical protein
MAELKKYVSGLDAEQENIFNSPITNKKGACAELLGTGPLSTSYFATSLTQHRPQSR